MKTYRGFTLIEMIIVIVLLGIISAIASSMLAQGFSSYITSKNVTNADWQGRLALERMARDIRTIRSPTDITTIGAASLTFTNINNTSVTYSLSAGNLILNSQILAYGISNLSFTYLDGTGATTLIPSAVRHITIAITVTLNNVNYTATTSVYPRNLP